MRIPHHLFYNNFNKATVLTELSLLTAQTSCAAADFKLFFASFSEWIQNDTLSTTMFPQTVDEQWKSLTQLWRICLLNYSAF